MRQLPNDSVSGISRNLVRESSVSSGEQRGDVCAFIVPSYTEARFIRSQLTSLQLRYGGEAADLKLLSQRFTANEAQLELLKMRLKNLANATAPLAVMGEKVEPFYSTFHEQEILKCHVRVNSALQSFYNQLGHTLIELDIDPHLADMPTKLTLLEDVHMSRLQQEGYRRLLFVGQRVTLAKVKAPGHYTELFSAAFSQALSPLLRAVE